MFGTRKLVEEQADALREPNCPPHPPRRVDPLLIQPSRCSGSGMERAGTSRGWGTPGGPSLGVGDGVRFTSYGTATPRSPVRRGYRGHAETRGLRPCLKPHRMM